jgi:hypothetical protein
MRRIHLIAGVLALLAFLLSGQAMHFHRPPTHDLAPEFRLMFVSRHIYLLAGALVNLCLGMYLQTSHIGWRRLGQMLGSVLVVVSPAFSLLAFLYEPERGMVGHSWRTPAGLIPLFAGVMLHLVSRIGEKRSAALN